MILYCTCQTCKNLTVGARIILNPNSIQVYADPLSGYHNFFFTPTVKQIIIDYLKEDKEDA